MCVTVESCIPHASVPPAGLPVRRGPKIPTPTRRAGATTTNKLQPKTPFLFEVARKHPLYLNAATVQPLSRNCKIIVNRFSECVRKNACKDFGLVTHWLYSFAYPTMCSLLCIHSERSTKNSLVLLCKYKFLFFCNNQMVHTCTLFTLFNFLSFAWVDGNRYWCCMLVPLCIMVLPSKTDDESIYFCSTSD